MRAHRLTMSRMGLAHACLHGFRMDVEQHPRPVGEAARVGSCFHALVEAPVMKRDTASSAETPEEAAKALALFKSPIREWIDSVPWTSCELGLDYDASRDVAVPCPRRGEAGYEDVEPMHLRGTLDLVRVDLESGSADVVDLKTGQKANSDPNQLYAQAVAVSRLFGVKRVRVAFAYARKTKFDPPEFEELDEDRLDEEAGRIARALRRLPMAEPERGDHCWRCDARPGCRAWASDAA